MVAAARLLPVFPARLDEPCDEVASRAQAGPRYTSYPPATRFHAGFGSEDAARALADRDFPREKSERARTLVWLVALSPDFAVQK